MVTGPNMGGKSTFIRQVAISCLLAHVGCPVPASFLELTVLSGIYTRVGASDMQLKGVSTFFAEMLETSNMLRHADSRALMIVDELGRGTSTLEGLNIAKATAEYIHSEARCFSLFATHFHQITKLADQSQGIGNLYLETGTDSNKTEDDFTYKVQFGSTSKSFGINIIKGLKFPQEIIQRSLNILQLCEGTDNQNDI